MCFQSPHEPPKKDMSFEAVRRRHFKRYVNLPAAIYKTSPFSEFSAWITAQEKLAAMSGASQLDLDWA
jgi:hypothetical protein